MIETDDWSFEQSWWIWWVLVGLVLIHIGAGITTTLISPTAPEGIFGIIAGLAAGLAVVIAVGRMVQIYLARQA